MKKLLKKLGRLGAPAMVLISAILCTACTSTYSVERAGWIDVPPRLDGQGEVHVSVSADGGIEEKTYAGSGLMTSEAVVAAFSSHAARVVLGAPQNPPGTDPLKSALGGAMYRVVPTILHWEDRATEWTGEPDVIKVRIKVFEGEGGALLDSVLLHGVSKWATMGGDHPQDMLIPLLAEYVESIYRE